MRGKSSHGPALARPGRHLGTHSALAAGRCYECLHGGSRVGTSAQLYSSIGDKFICPAAPMRTKYESAPPAPQRALHISLSPPVSAHGLLSRRVLRLPSPPATRCRLAQNHWENYKMEVGQTAQNEIVSGKAAVEGMEALGKRVGGFGQNGSAEGIVQVHICAEGLS